MSALRYSYSSYTTLPGRRPGLLWRLLGGALSLLALILAAFLGLFVFLAVLGLVAAGSLIAAVRLAWLRRQLAKEDGTAPPFTRGKSRYIDAEFTDHEER